jgi:N-acyl-D-amino-acid deacylase
LFAEVVVFDPVATMDVATFPGPEPIVGGREHVFVNGIGVVKDGKVTDAKPGVALRGPGYQRPS